MKKLAQDKSQVKVRMENADDLWYLSQVLDAGDLLSARTLRKLKIGGEGDRKQNVVKKPVFLKIRLEKIEFSDSQTELRALGTIQEGPEDLPRGEHHTINIAEGTELTIEKEWLNYQRKKLEEAFASKQATILIVVFDREEAHVALLKKYGHDILTSLKGNVQKKAHEQQTSNFYMEIIKALEEYDQRLKPQHIILASPAFWKEELMHHLKDHALKEKAILATCSSADKTAINEVLKRDEVREVLASDRTARELRFVEDLMKAVNDGKAAYGKDETKEAADAGAMETLLVTDGLIHKTREGETFSEIEAIMKAADQTDAQVHIVSSKHEGGQKLDGLGGIAAILSYKLK